MQAAGKSVTGMRRSNNEDAIYLSQEDSPVYGLYMVADGMGGCNAGEIASHQAIDAFLEYARAEMAEQGRFQEPLDLLVGAMAASNQVVYKKSLESEELAEMGTTLVAAILISGKLYVAHVGDSRAYVFQNGGLRQITADHSYVMELVRLGNLTLEQAAVHPKRHIITRAIGTKDTVNVDTVICDLSKGDIVLICSDGLSNMISPDEMAAILSEPLCVSEKCSKLVNLANQHGGEDNISVILIEE